MLEYQEFTAVTITERQSFSSSCALHGELGVDIRLTTRNTMSDQPNMTGLEVF